MIALVIPLISALMGAVISKGASNHVDDNPPISPGSGGSASPISPYAPSPQAVPIVPVPLNGGRTPIAGANPDWNRVVNSSNISGTAPVSNTAKRGDELYSIGVPYAINSVVLEQMRAMD